MEKKKGRCENNHTTFVFLRERSDGEREDDDDLTKSRKHDAATIRGAVRDADGDARGGSGGGQIQGGAVVFVCVVWRFSFDG